MIAACGGSSRGSRKAGYGVTLLDESTWYTTTCSSSILHGFASFEITVAIGASLVLGAVGLELVDQRGYLRIGSVIVDSSVVLLWWWWGSTRRFLGSTTRAWSVASKACQPRRFYKEDRIATGVFGQHRKGSTLPRWIPRRGWNGTGGWRVLPCLALVVCAVYGGFFHFGSIQQGMMRHTTAIIPRQKIRGIRHRCCLRLPDFFGGLVPQCFPSRTHKLVKQSIIAAGSRRTNGGGHFSASQGS